MGDLSKKRQNLYLFMFECSLPNELTEVCQRQPADKMWPYSSIQIVYLFLSHYQIKQKQGPVQIAKQHEVSCST